MINKKKERKGRPSYRDDDMDDFQLKAKKKMPKQKYRHQRAWIESDDMMSDQPND